MNEQLEKLRELARYLQNPGDDGHDWIWEEAAESFVAKFLHLDYCLSNGVCEVPEEWQDNIFRKEKRNQL